MHEVVSVRECLDHLNWPPLNISTFNNKGPVIPKGQKLKNPDLGPILGHVLILVWIRVRCIDSSKVQFGSMDFSEIPQHLIRQPILCIICILSIYRRFTRKIKINKYRHVITILHTGPLFWA